MSTYHIINYKAMPTAFLLVLNSKTRMKKRPGMDPKHFCGHPKMACRRPNEGKKFPNPNSIS